MLFFPLGLIGDLGETIEERIFSNELPELFSFCDIESCEWALLNFVSFFDKGKGTKEEDDELEEEDEEDEEENSERTSDTVFPIRLTRERPLGPFGSSSIGDSPNWGRLPLLLEGTKFVGLASIVAAPLFFVELDLFLVNAGVPSPALELAEVSLDFDLLVPFGEKADEGDKDSKEGDEGEGSGCGNLNAACRMGTGETSVDFLFSSPKGKLEGGGDVEGEQQGGGDVEGDRISARLRS